MRVNEIFSIFQTLFQMSFAHMYISSFPLEPTSKAQAKDDYTAALHQGNTSEFAGRGTVHPSRRATATFGGLKSLGSVGSGCPSCCSAIGLLPPDKHTLNCQGAILISRRFICNNKAFVQRYANIDRERRESPGPFFFFLCFCCLPVAPRAVNSERMNT